MAVTYIVQQGPSATGPWTAVTGSPFSSANCTISGETPNTSYYVQITAQDLVLGISSTPAVFGPYTTLPTSSESPAGTTVTTVGPSINASPTPGSAGQGNLLTITSGGQIALNGTTLGGANVTELYYTGASAGANGATSHTAYQENNAGNWYGPITASGTGTQIAGSPIPAGPAIAISTIGTQTTNTPFSVSGTLSGYSSAPTLLYNDNGGAFAALPVSNTVSATSFTFTHPSITSAEAAATVAVEDANNTIVTATSNAYQVSAPVAGAPNAPTISATSEASSSVTLSTVPPTTGGSRDYGSYVYQYQLPTAGTAWTTFGSVIKYITPGGGANQFTDGSGFVWTITTGGVIQRNGTSDTSTANVTQVVLLPNGTVWQLNTANNWYTQTVPATTGDWTGPITTSPLTSPGITITGLTATPPQSYNFRATVSNSSGASLPSAVIAAATISSSGVFTVSFSASRNGNVIIGPNGNEWYGRGVDVAGFNGNEVLQAAVQAPATTPLTGSFPGLNVVGVYCWCNGFNSTDMQTLAPQINALTAAGIVVILMSDNTAYIQSVPNNGDGSLAAEVAAVSAAATQFKNNPYVWFRSSNEPGDAPGSGSVGTEHLAVYNAVRNAGNNSIVVICDACQGGTTLNYSNYAGMVNVISDQHIYPGLGTGAAAITNRVADNGNFAGGEPMWDLIIANGFPMPMLCGENGPAYGGGTGSGGYSGATTSSEDDTIPTSIFAQAPYTNEGGSGGKNVLICGWMMWGVWDDGTSDVFYTGGGGAVSGPLTPYGTATAQAIASGASSQ